MGIFSHEWIVHFDGSIIVSGFSLGWSMRCPSRTFEVKKNDKYFCNNVHSNEFPFLEFIE